MGLQKLRSRHDRLHPVTRIADSGIWGDYIFESPAGLVFHTGMAWTKPEFSHSGGNTPSPEGGEEQIDDVY
jgi:hypothetical protein